MSTIEGYLSVDHKRCDQQFAEMETRVVKKSWAEAGDAFSEFKQMLLIHLRMEEEALFPEFEKVSGMAGGGPTMVMKMEHEHMRQALNDLENKINEQDYRASAGLLETMMLLMQQHNMKEEQILYRMADQALGSGVNDMLDQFEKIKQAGL